MPSAWRRRPVSRSQPAARPCRGHAARSRRAPGRSATGRRSPTDNLALRYFPNVAENEPSVAVNPRDPDELVAGTHLTGRHGKPLRRPLQRQRRPHVEPDPDLHAAADPRVRLQRPGGRLRARRQPRLLRLHGHRPVVDLQDPRQLLRRRRPELDGADRRHEQPGCRLRQAVDRDARADRRQPEQPQLGLRHGDEVRLRQHERRLPHRLRALVEQGRLVERADDTRHRQLRRARRRGRRARFASAGRDRQRRARRLVPLRRRRLPPGGLLDPDALLGEQRRHLRADRHGRDRLVRAAALPRAGRSPTTPGGAGCSRTSRSRRTARRTSSMPTTPRTARRSRTATSATWRRRGRRTPSGASRRP